VIFCNKLCVVNSAAAGNRAAAHMFERSMSQPSFAAIILAAGSGTRMKSAMPKVMHPIAGRPMITYPLEALRPLSRRPGSGRARRNRQSHGPPRGVE
jgi:UDP-N-acetylglucosamine pyrophosphorylase